MTCGKEPYNADAYASGLAPKCILNAKHTGPHTDGDKQWNVWEPETLDSNYDIAAKEARQPTPAPVDTGWKAPKPECTTQCDIHQNIGGFGPRCILTVGHTGEHDFGSGGDAAIEPKQVKFINLCTLHKTPELEALFALDSEGQIWERWDGKWSKFPMPVL